MYIYIYTHTYILYELVNVSFIVTQYIIIVYVIYLVQVSHFTL